METGTWDNLHGKAQCVPQMSDLHPDLLLDLGSGKPLLGHLDVAEAAMEHVLVFLNGIVNTGFGVPKAIFRFLDFRH